MAASSRIKNVAIALGGCIVAGVGCCTVLYVYAYSSMVSPHVLGLARTLLILEKMFLSLNVIPTLFGLFSFGGGLAIVAVSPKLARGISTRDTRVPAFFVALAFVTLFLAVLLAIVVSG
jgi:hypothetical protein